MTCLSSRGRRGDSPPETSDEGGLFTFHGENRRRRKKEKNWIAIHHRDGNEVPHRANDSEEMDIWSGDPTNQENERFKVVGGHTGRGGSRLDCSRGPNTKSGHTCKKGKGGEKFLYKGERPVGRKRGKSGVTN